MNDTLKFCKVRTVKSPNRAHSDDAGIDFYFPEDLPVETFKAKCEMTKQNVTFSEENGIVKSVTIKPLESVLIPSGIHVKIPNGYALIFMNKSGVATKKHLHVGASVVDENYQGECHFNFANVGDTPVTIEAGEKVVQGLVIPINYCQTEEYKSLTELYSGAESDRGAGGFGSSGTK